MSGVGVNWLLFIEGALGSLVFSKSFFTCSSNLSSLNELLQQEPQHPAVVLLLQHPFAPNACVLHQVFNDENMIRQQQPQASALESAMISVKVTSLGWRLNRRACVMVRKWEGENLFVELLFAYLAVLCYVGGKVWWSLINGVYVRRQLKYRLLWLNRLCETLLS